MQYCLTYCSKLWPVPDSRYSQYICDAIMLAYSIPRLLRARENICLPMTALSSAGSSALAGCAPASGFLFVTWRSVPRGLPML